MILKWKDWLYTREEAARLCLFGVLRPFENSPIHEHQGLINAIYYTRLELHCMFGINNPEQYSSEEQILQAYEILRHTPQYCRVAAYLIIRKSLSFANVTCTDQQIIAAMESGVGMEFVYPSSDGITPCCNPIAVATLLSQNPSTAEREEADTRPTKLSPLMDCVTNAENELLPPFPTQMVEHAAICKWEIPWAEYIFFYRCGVNPPARPLPLGFYPNNEDDASFASEEDSEADITFSIASNNEESVHGANEDGAEPLSKRPKVADDDSLSFTSNNEGTFSVAALPKDNPAQCLDVPSATDDLTSPAPQRSHSSSATPTKVTPLPEDEAATDKSQGVVVEFNSLHHDDGVDDDLAVAREDEESYKDSQSDTDDDESSAYEEQPKKKKSTSSASSVVKSSALYKGTNKCGACDNGLGGILASNAAKAPAVSSDTTAADEYDIFDGSSFTTGSKDRVPWREVEELKGKGNKMKLQQFIFKHAGKIIHHSIDGSEENRALAAIVYHSAANGHIQAISSKSQSSKDPKTKRSGWTLVGGAKSIQSEWPAGYSPRSSARGEVVVKGLNNALAANCAAVGALRAKAHLFGHIWKGGVPSTDVGGKGDKGGLLISSHTDQNKANDPVFYTARKCIATITPFNIDFILFFVCFNNSNKTKQSKHKIGSITLTLTENTTYYLSHRLSGRAALALTKCDGKEGLLIVEHCVHLKQADMKKHRGVLIEDYVFPTEESHNRFLDQVDSNNEMHQLPSTFNNIVSLFNELAATDPSLVLYAEGEKLFTNVSNTIKNLRPYANQFNLQCSYCSNTATALDLREDEEEYGGRSGEDLLSYIQSTYKKDDLLDGDRLLCSDCASDFDIPDGYVLLNSCSRCLVRKRLASLGSCTTCGDYHCGGYPGVGGTRVYACVPDGVKLDETNTTEGNGGAICKACKKAYNAANYERNHKRKTNIDEDKVIMRALYELYDETWRAKEENKKFLRGKTGQISWKMVLHPEDGYGPLKGKKNPQTKDKFHVFRTHGGKDIETLAQYDDYIKNGGLVGRANSGKKRA